MTTDRQPCALLMNDVHVSKDNIAEFHANWNEALSLCKQHGIKTLVIGGDLWQSRSSQTLSTLLAVRHAIIEATTAGIHVWLAEGNHDKVDQESLLGYSHLFSHYPRVGVVDGYVVLPIGDNTDLYVMSYFPEDGSFVGRLKEIQANIIDRTRRTLLYIHQGINGGLAVPHDKELPAHIFANFDAVLVGHYHDRKRIPGTPIEYIGSSRQHNFGEDEQKGYTIVYTDGSYSFVQNQANTRYRVVELTPSEIDSDLLEEIAEIKQTGKYKLKAKVRCSSQEAGTIDKQQLIEAGVTKIEVLTESTTPTETTSHSLQQKFDKAGIKNEYASFCHQKATSSEMGLYYLEKIS